MVVGKSGAALAAAVAAVIALAGCTGQSKPGPTTFVTVTAGAGASGAASRPVTTPSKRATPTPSVVAMRKLPGTCDSLLPLGSIVNALGHKVPGRTAFVVGQPDSATGRVTYLNCRYGLSRKQPSPGVEIGVNLYRTAAKAAGRIQPTVDDYTQHGARAAQVQVEGLPATVLVGGAGAGYGPTIVLSAGQRTVVVTLRRAAVPAAGVVKDLVAVAALAVQRTSAG